MDNNQKDQNERCLSDANEMRDYIDDVRTESREYRNEASDEVSAWEEKHMGETHRCDKCGRSIVIGKSAIVSFFMTSMCDYEMTTTCASGPCDDEDQPNNERDANGRYIRRF